MRYLIAIFIILLLSFYFKKDIDKKYRLIYNPADSVIITNPEFEYNDESTTYIPDYYDFYSDDDSSKVNKKIKDKKLKKYIDKDSLFVFAKEIKIKKIKKNLATYE